MVIIPVAQPVCEAVDGALAVDGDLAERDARIERDVGLPVDISDLSGRDRDGVAPDGLDGQGAAGLRGQLGKAAVAYLHRAAGLQRDRAGKARGTVGDRLAARPYEHRVAVAAENRQCTAVVHGDHAGNAEHTGVAVAGQGRRAAHVQVCLQFAVRQVQLAFAFPADLLFKGHKGEVALTGAVDRALDGSRPRCYLAALGADNVASDGSVPYLHRSAFGDDDVTSDGGVLYRRRTALAAIDFACDDGIVYGQFTGTSDSSCKRTVVRGAVISYDAKLRTLFDLDVALHLAADCGVQQEGAGTYGQVLRAVAQEGQRAVLVCVGLRCGEGIRRVNVADDVGDILFTVFVLNRCGNVAVAFRTGALVLVAEPASDGDSVVAVGNVNDENLREQLVAAICEFNTVSSAVVDCEILRAERRVHSFCGRDGLCCHHFAGAFFYQRRGDFSGLRSVQHAGGRCFYLGAIRGGRGSIQRNMFGLRGNGHRRGDNGNSFFDPIIRPLVGNIL